MTMQCWPDDTREYEAWDRALRRGIRRAIAPSALAAALAGALAWAALAQAGDGWMAVPGAPSLTPAPTLPDSCQVDGWWSYHPACCCTHGWCARIACDTVTERGGGYLVRLPAGAHPRVRSPLSVVVPRADARPSPDGECHLCASKAETGPGQARCLLVPAGVM